MSAISIYFHLSIPYGSFISNLVQNSTIFISLVATFVFLLLALVESQYVSQYVVIYTNIADKHSIVAFSLCFSVAVATHISLASHLNCITKPHSLHDVGPLRAGLTIARVICECHCIGLCYQSSGPTNFCPKTTIEAVEGLSSDSFLY